MGSALSWLSCFFLGGEGKFRGGGIALNKWFTQFRLSGSGLAQRWGHCLLLTVNSKREMP